MQQFLDCSLKEIQHPGFCHKEIAPALEHLLKFGFIEKKPWEDGPTGQDFYYEVTPLGKATYTSAYSPAEALIVREELDRAMHGLV